MLFWTFLINRYRTWRIYRETFLELANLDDRTLADLNVGRGDIDAISRRAARDAVAA